MPTKFYPALSTIIPADSIPDNLGFIKNGATYILNHCFYKDLQITRSSSGDAGFYAIRILTYKRIGFEFPGTGGMALVVNPAVPENNPGYASSEFLVSLGYKWSILKFSKIFTGIPAFDFSPASFYGLVLDISQINSVVLLSELIHLFIEDSDPIQKFVDDFNTKHNPPTPLVKSTDPNEELVIADLISQMKENGNEFDVYTVIFNDYLNTDAEIVLTNLEYLFFKWLGYFSVEDITAFIIPQVLASLHNINLALEFPRSILKPVNPQNGLPYEDESIKSMLTFNVGSLHFTLDKGLDFQNTGNFDFTKSQIANTGFTVEFSNARLDLSKTSSLPEILAAGYPPDFMGVFIEHAAIGLPSFLQSDENIPSGQQAQIIGKNLIIGTGGFSGKIILDDSGNQLGLRLGSQNGFSLQFESFTATFQQNAITGSSIHGSMVIPGFTNAQDQPAHINIDAYIGTNGEFCITASENQGIQALNIKDILNVTIKSLSVGRKAQRWFVAVSGDITFYEQDNFIGQFIPDSIEVQKLLIWQDGEIEFEGGTLVLPDAITLKLPPVELSITALGMGTHRQIHQEVERRYRFFEFSGGINVNPGGVDARGDGIKFFFTTDNDPETGLNRHVFVRIQGIYIDLEISAGDPKKVVLLLEGYLAMKNPESENEEAGVEYSGGVSFSLPKLKIAGSADLRYNPNLPAFLVDIEMEMSKSILLGSTGLGIYGFRGLFGQRYVVSKHAAGLEDEAPWWQYYKAKIAEDYKEGIWSSKFETKQGFSLGAGISLATAPDSGRSFSSKIFVLLSLPEVLLLQGQGQILRERIGLADTNDPPFFAMVAISSQSVEAAFGAKILLPEENRPGSIARIDALMEMGFYFENSSAWYINLGKDQPENERINVRLLDLFDAYFYFMLSSAGIRAGAGASYRANKKVGPLEGRLHVYLDVAGKIAFRPRQYGASIQLGGSAGLYIFGIGVSVSVHAGVAAEAPKPFIVSGNLKACATILKKERCIPFSFTWVKDTTLDTTEIPVLNRPMASKATNMLTQESFKLLSTAAPLNSLNIESLADYTIPMDSFIDLEFLEGVKPATSVIEQFGGNTQGIEYQRMVPPQKGKSPRVVHHFLLEEVNIYIHSNGNWQPYDLS